MENKSLVYMDCHGELAIWTDHGERIGVETADKDISFAKDYGLNGSRAMLFAYCTMESVLNGMGYVKLGEL